MFNIFASFIGNTLSPTRDKVTPFTAPRQATIQELAQEEHSAVAGAPEVDNDPDV
jgi:hypothetical protein